VHAIQPAYEQQVTDGFLRTDRWTSRTVRITGHINGHSAKNRVQAALEHVDRDWMVMEERAIYYVVICKSRDKLAGWEHLVATHPPPEGPTTELYGALQGPNIYHRLIVEPVIIGG
jgi:hypothetical protein